MKYQRILIPYDGSEPSKAAFSVARDLIMGEADSKLLLLNVVPMASAPALTDNDPIAGVSPAFMDPQSYTELFDSALASIEQEMKAEITELLDGLPASQVSYEVVSHPSAIQAISDYAEDHDCDLIIMGRRGLGAIRGMIGSVSYGVLRSVDIPVLTVK